MKYNSLSQNDKKEMLKTIGISSPDKLFDSIPDDIKLKKDLNIPSALSEPETWDTFNELASKNSPETPLSFLGGGAYLHYIPAAVDYLSSRGEFVSPYTPYQAEVSQGTLHLIFEFQTMICQLTGMDISNASLYDGASGAAEAVLMSHRIQRKPKILIPKTLHPHYRQVIQTYTKNLGLEIQEVSYDESGQMDTSELKKKLDKETSAVVCQSPNFFGVIEDLEVISKLAHESDALSISVVAEASSLGILKSPGEMGADIVTGEAQSFGIPLSFGGPYLGFMSCRKDFLRQFPGRISGQTKDVDGKRGFVLTLSTREQHIRRERATSNICTNQALCMLRATIFLELLGKKGMREWAWQNIQKASYANKVLTDIKGVESRFSGQIYNEFVIKTEKKWRQIQEELKKKNIVPGISLEKYYPELKGCGLVCVTETRKKKDIDTLAEAFEDLLKS
ncbi:MAG: aminomethyl-transferring glycine dehydrogenase subunit GcvPA [Candidatus Aminicenantes bacterium]|nr:aminomethyl-transferring glycine dehydrogenase subunit GcvPA [Candidatus Aminicenantes bacterium]